MSHTDAPDDQDWSALRKALREYLARVATPERVEQDDEEHRPPVDLLRSLGELGYLSVGLPEKWGGAGGTVEMVQLMEELGRFHPALGRLVGRVMYGQQLLVALGTEEQQATWLPRLAAGQAVVAISFTEPEAGSDLAAVRTTATRSGDGFVLNGQKVFSSSFGYADVALVLARTGEPGSGRDGLTTFLVDPRSPGIVSRPMRTLGDWATTTYEVFYTDVAVPFGAVLGGLGNGWRVARQHLMRERLIMASRLVGATAALLESTADFVQTRRQFGHPIGDFQSVRHRLADMRIQLQMARAGLYAVARQPVSEEAAVDAAAVKVFASEMYAKAAMTAMQLHGGAGYTRDLPFQRHYRDAPMYVIGGGSADVLRDVIARELLRGRGERSNRAADARR